MFDRVKPTDDAPDDSATAPPKRVRAPHASGYGTLHVPDEILAALDELVTELSRHGLDGVVDPAAAERADRYERPMALGHVAGYAIETMLAHVRTLKTPNRKGDK